MIVYGRFLNQPFNWMHFSFTAIRAKVLNESWDNSTRVYTVRIFKTYKGNKKIDRIAGMQSVAGKRRKSVVQITTELESTACGVRLDISKIYLLLGEVQNLQRGPPRGPNRGPRRGPRRGPHKGKKRLRIDSCQWHTLWKDTTAQQRRGLKKIYGENCSCNIEKYCFKGPPDFCNHLIAGCSIQGNDDRTTYCRGKHSYCVKSGKKCNWIFYKKADFKKCMKS